MIKTIIIDDEYLARLRVRKLLEVHTDKLEIMGEADCGKEAIEKIESLQPDLLFLDIHLPDMSGFEILAQLSYQPIIIFTTAYLDYAIKAFESFSVDYLVKPLEAKRFNMAIDKLEKFSKNSSPDFKELEAFFQQIKTPKKTFSLAIKKRDKIILVEFEDITYLKAEDKYVQINLNNGTTHWMNKSMNQLEEELPEEFIRVHRSYIVNRNYIFEIQKYFKGKLLLKLKDKNQSVITSSETYAKKIKEIMGL